MALCIKVFFAHSFVDGTKLHYGITMYNLIDLPNPMFSYMDANLNTIHNQPMTRPRAQCGLSVPFFQHLQAFLGALDGGRLPTQHPHRIRELMNLDFN